MNGSKLFVQVFLTLILTVAFSVFLFLYIDMEFAWEVAIVVLFTVLVSFFVSKHISKPIEEIQRTAEEIARGNFSGRTETGGSREIKALADALNKMARELERRIEKISLQKNEQEAMFLSMKEGVIAINTREEIIRINRAALKFFGISATAPELKYKRVFEVIRNAEMLDFIRASLNTDEHLEREITVYGEKERILLVNADPLFDVKENKIGTIVVMNNITRIKHLDKMRQEFVANVSHELKTPITSIKGYVETLLSNPDVDEETRVKFLSVINKQSDRLNAIIDDLLQLAKLDKNKDIELSEGEICPVLENATQCCAKKIASKNISLKISCEENLTARINENLLERALANLIDNAVKYSDEAGEVIIAAEKKNGAIRISVKDFGAGIAKERHARLFERFYRVDKSRSRELGGTGLGLAIVKHIALVHGGKVYVKSEPGKGSEFVIELPTSQ